jgi:hypothetical protein
MPQHRYWDFGSPVPATADNTVNRVLNDAGVYIGLDLDVDSTSGLLVVTPGFGLQPNGVIWEEDVNVSLSFVPPGIASNYTVVATHEFEQRINGTPVEYDILSGISTSVVDGVILGYIYHPGGGVPIAVDQLQSVPKNLPNTHSADLLDLAPKELVPEFPRSYHDVSSSGPDTTFEPKLWTTVGQYLIYQKASNSPTAPGAQQVVQHIQFYVDEAPRPVEFRFYVDIPNAPNTNLEVQVYGTDQVLVPVTGSPVGFTVGWETRSVTVARTGGTFDAGKPYTLRLVFNLGIGQEISMGRLKAIFWPYPT